MTTKKEDKILTPQERSDKCDILVKAALKKTNCQLISEPVVVRIPLGKQWIYGLDSIPKIVPNPE